MSKKYKLFSASTGTTDGSRPPCAFYASPSGCRNGDNCKFEHVLPEGREAPSDARSPPEKAAQNRLGRSASAGSMISSESSSDGEIHEEEKLKSSRNQGRLIIKQEEIANESSFAQVAAGEQERSGSMEGNEHAAVQQERSEKKKKKRKGKRSMDEDGDPFAKPKKSKTLQQEAFARLAKPQNPKTTAVAGGGAATPTKGPPNQNYAGRRDESTPPNKAVDFRSLNLPVAAFSCAANKSPENATASTPATTPQTPQTIIQKKPEKINPPKPPTPSPSPPELPLPTSTAAGRQWLEMVQKTRQHSRYQSWYDFNKYQEMDHPIGGKQAWIKAKPFGSWCAENPAVIGVDCEMCETQDPVSGQRDPHALCRVSVVSVTDDCEVLLDTLVKPAWPVVDYRTRINGIAEEHLAPVHFTLRHAQAFLLALCSEETVIMGHAVHNDLAALRMEHDCVVDSAALFSCADSPTATVSLKDLAAHVLKKSMPETHDSVNDARTAVRCLEHYRAKGGEVEAIPRSGDNNNKKMLQQQYGKKLFLHRIPKNQCNEKHLARMFLEHTAVEPDEVNPIDFSTGNMGKTHAVFRTPRHATLAFDTLDDRPEPDPSGRLQKKVYLKSGTYIRIRKMAFEHHQQKTNNNKDNHKNNNNTNRATS